MWVELRDLTLVLHGRQILSGVHMNMQPGQIYGLLGPNGAGKSTTISVLTGLRAATSGRVSVLGMNPWERRKEIHRDIGVLPEQAGFYGWMGAHEYLQWFAGLYNRRLASSDIERHLAQVGLEATNYQRIDTYSRGMKQRLGLARALLNGPAFLVLDEPTNGLDPRGRREIHDVLLELSKEQGVGILLCTHLLDDVDRLCSRIGILHQGKTIIEGNLAELLVTLQTGRRYRLRLLAPPKNISLPTGMKLGQRVGEWWYLDIGASFSPDEVWRSLLDAGWPITEIHSEGGGLEDFYLKLTRTEAVA